LGWGIGFVLVPVIFQEPSGPILKALTHLFWSYAMLDPEFVEDALGELWFHGFLPAVR
jgi:hypothetical protein